MDFDESLIAHDTSARMGTTALTRTRPKNTDRIALTTSPGSTEQRLMSDFGEEHSQVPVQPPVDFQQRPEVSRNSLPDRFVIRTVSWLKDMYRTFNRMVKATGCGQQHRLIA
jgi:hypothetical protein